MVQKSNAKKPTAKKRISDGDIITINNVGAGSAVAAGRNSSAKVISTSSSNVMEKWVSETNARIDALKNTSRDEKEDIKEQVEKIGVEVQKGPKAEKNRLEKLINTLSVMTPDIFDVVLASLQSPIAGIGMVIKKIDGKIKLEKSGM